MSRPKQTRLLVLNGRNNSWPLVAERFAATRRDVALAHTVPEAARLAENEPFDVAVLDLSAFPAGGVAPLFEQLRRRNADAQLILLTEAGTIETTLRAIQFQEYKAQAGSARSAGQAPKDQGAILGTSPAIRHVLRLIDKVACTDEPVLIQGETGTGKELAARAIHLRSPRAAKPLVVFNSAAIHDSLLESELFGHEKGAFTSAVSSAPGLIEAAEGGTLFIDEIGDMALGFQAKLLRVLEDHRVRRVGSTRWRPIHARVVVATNKDLAEQVAERRFRADLYYRLNVLSLRIPPLRERREDIPLLVRHFLSLDPQRPQEVDLEALRALTRHAWPGNVRELRNVIRRAQLLVGGPRITPHDLQVEVRGTGEAGPGAALPSPAPRGAALEELERQHISQVLDSQEWNKSRAATVLGISRHRLYRLMQKYDLSRTDEVRS